MARTSYKSEQIKCGVDRAPNRSLLAALGLTEEEMSRPIVGVVSSYNEIVPGHMHLDKISEAVKAGAGLTRRVACDDLALLSCPRLRQRHDAMREALRGASILG